MLLNEKSKTPAQFVQTLILFVTKTLAAQQRRSPLNRARARRVVFYSTKHKNSQWFGGGSESECSKEAAIELTMEFADKWSVGHDSDVSFRWLLLPLVVLGVVFNSCCCGCGGVLTKCCLSPPPSPLATADIIGDSGGTRSVLGVSAARNAVKIVKHFSCVFSALKLKPINF